MNLIKDCGIEKWLEGALETKIIAGVQIGDLDQRNVVPNIGPLQLRGVWYPCMNIGIGAPKGTQFKKLDNTKNV